MSLLRSTLSILLAATTIFAHAESFVTLDKTHFMVDGKTIPAGCLAQLMTQLNGDNIVSGLFLTSASLRGCINANDPYPSGDEDRVKVTKAEKHADNRYGIQVCESIDGSMGQHCDSFLVRFERRNYSVKGIIKDVLVVEKTGDWDPKTAP